jgi:hypothetical protein
MCGIFENDIPDCWGESEGKNGVGEGGVMTIRKEGEKE